MMKSLITTAFALAALSAAGSAQQQVQQIETVQKVGHATLDLATGVTTRGSQSDNKCDLVLSYENVDGSGYYGVGHTAAEEWVDWGVISGVHNHASDIVGEFWFGYGTTVLDTVAGGPGVTLCLNFYDDTVGWCAESGLGIAPTAQYCWSGLAGSPDGVTGWGWIYSVSLVGGGEFMQDASEFGFGMSWFDTLTGPLLQYAGDGNGGADTNGQIDAFDAYEPDMATGTCGTYFFGGGVYNFSSWYLRLYVGDGIPTASCTWYCGSGANAGTDGFVVVNNPTLGGSFDVAVTGCATGNVGALMAGFSSSAVIPTKWGELLLNVADPNGELLGLPAGFGGTAAISLGVPANMLFCGFNLFVQAASFGGSVCLHCAWDCIIGF